MAILVVLVSLVPCVLIQFIKTLAKYVIGKVHIFIFIFRIKKKNEPGVTLPNREDFAIGECPINPPIPCFTCYKNGQDASGL